MRATWYAGLAVVYALLLAFGWYTASYFSPALIVQLRTPVVIIGPNGWPGDSTDRIVLCGK